MQWLFPVTHAAIIWLMVLLLFLRFCPHYFITFRLKIIDFFLLAKIKHKVLENLNYNLKLEDEQLLI